MKMKKAKKEKKVVDKNKWRYVYILVWEDCRIFEWYILKTVWCEFDVKLKCRKTGEVVTKRVSKKNLGFSERFTDDIIF